MTLNTLHYITLRYITVHTLHTLHTLHYTHYFTLHTLHTVHYFTLPYLTLPYLTLHYVPLHYTDIPLHYTTFAFTFSFTFTLHYITYVTLECPAKVSSKSVQQERQARECFQECPAKRCCSLMTVRVISTKKRQVFSFLRSFLCTLLYIK